MKHSRKPIVLLLSLFLFLAAYPLTANELKVNAGLWYGERTPELEKRFFMDDLFDGFGFSGRINTPWEGISSVTFYPAGIEYFLDIGGHKGFVGANYSRGTNEATYKGFTASSISLVTLEKFATSDFEGYLGFQFKQNNFLLSPRIGVRNHSESFTYNEQTFGNQALSMSFGDNIWDATARGPFVGGEAKVEVSPGVSLVVDLMFTLPFVGGFFGDWGGEMNSTRMIVGMVGNNAMFSYENAVSGYRIKLNRFTLGAEYKINDTFSVQGGLRFETLSASYPEYFNIPISSIGGWGGFDVNEWLTDLFIYESTYTSEKGTIYLQASVTI